MHPSASLAAQEADIDWLLKQGDDVLARVVPPGAVHAVDAAAALVRGTAAFGELARTARSSHPWMPGSGKPAAAVFPATARVCVARCSHLRLAR